MRANAGTVIVVAILAACAACSLLVSADGLTGTHQASDAGSSADAPAVSDAAVESDAPPPQPTCGRGPADPDLVAYYPLDEDSGTTVHDCSGRGHDGTIISAPDGGSWAPGLFGGGFRADGTAGCIELGNPPDLLVEQRVFTATAWVRPITYFGGNGATRYVVGRSRNADILGWRVAGDAPAQLDIEIATTSDAGSIHVNTANNLPANVWYHVAAVFEPGVRAAIYLDGQLVQEVAPAPAAIAADTPATFRVACRSTGDRNFDGTIDEVRIYHRALSATEIAALAKKP